MLIWSILPESAPVARSSHSSSFPTFFLLKRSILWKVVGELPSTVRFYSVSFYLSSWHQLGKVEGSIAGENRKLTQSTSAAARNDEISTTLWKFVTIVLLDLQALELVVITQFSSFQKRLSDLLHSDNFIHRKARDIIVMRHEEISLDIEHFWVIGSQVHERPCSWASVAHINRTATRKSIETLSCDTFVMIIVMLWSYHL